MNKILLIGRITFKPELVFTSGNIPYTKFGVAVKRDFKNANGEYETDFIPVQVWRRQAENVVNYLDKGSLVCIDGRIQTGTYTDKNGDKKATWVVVADMVDFLNVRPKAEEPKESPKEESDPFQDFGDELEEDEFLD